MDEERRILLEIETNLDKYRQEAADAGEEVRRLQKELRELKNSGEASAEEIENTSEQLRGARKEYREATKNVDDLTRASKAQAGSYEELQAQLRMAEKNLKTQAGLLTRNADGTIVLSEAYVKASREVEQARGAINEFNLGIHDGRTSVGLYKESIEKALGGMGIFGREMGMVGQMFSRTLPAGIATTNKSLGVLKMAIAATGIGALVVAIGSLIAYFRGAAEGQEEWAKIMAYFSGIVDALRDLFIDLGKWIRRAFEDPKQAVKDLWEAIKQNFINRFQGLIDLVVAGWTVIRKGAEGVGLAVAGIFNKEKRDQARAAFDEMRQGLVNMGEAALMVVTGVEDVMGKARQLGSEIRDRAEATRALQERENELRRLGIEDLTRMARLEADIAEARRISNDQQEEVTKQLEAQERAMALVDEKFRLQEARAKEALAIQQQRMALGHDTLEDMEKEAQMQADLIKLQQQRDNEIRSLLRRHGTLLNQIAAEEEAVRKALEAEAEARAKILDDIRRAGLTRIELLHEEMQEQLELHEWSAEERLQIERHYMDQIAEIRRAEREKEAEQRRREAAEMERVARELAEQEIAYRQMVIDTTISGTSHLLSALGNLAEEGSKLHKAFAIADAVINTYQGVTKALATLPPPASYIAAAATLVQGLAAVRRITRTRPGQANISGGGTQGAKAASGFVARRAAGAVTQGGVNLANVGQAVGTTQEQRVDRTDELIDAIQNMPPPVVAVETIERQSKRKRSVEIMADY